MSFNPRVNDTSIRMDSIAYAYAASITGEIFIAEGFFQQNRPFAVGHRFPKETFAAPESRRLSGVLLGACHIRCSDM
jgi:hypothetical protein